MDEYNRDLDPEVTVYFKKILQSFILLLLWLLGIGTAGFFFKLALIKTTWQWYHVVYYLTATITLAAMIYHLYKIWARR